MPGKPDAARGKTTRKGRIKKIGKRLAKLASERMASGTGMSPGAMGGRTKAKVTPRTTKMPAGLRRITENMRRQKLKGTMPMAGAGLTAAASRLAKRIKPTGRLNADDIKRVKQMMSKRKGK